MPRSTFHWLSSAVGCQLAICVVHERLSHQCQGRQTRFERDALRTNAQCHSDPIAETIDGVEFLRPQNHHALLLDGSCLGHGYPKALEAAVWVVTLRKYEAL